MIKDVDTIYKYIYVSFHYKLKECRIIKIPLNIVENLLTIVQLRLEITQLFKVNFTFK